MRIIFAIALIASAAAWLPTAALAVNCQAYCAKRCANAHGSMATLCPVKCMDACRVHNSQHK